MERRLQLLTNLAFLTLCVVGIALGVRSLFWPAPPTPIVVAGAGGAPQRPPRPVYTDGEKLDVPGVSFSESEYTLILVTQKGCTFCDQSMPFYKTLGDDDALSKRTRIVLLAPDDEQVTLEELKKFGVRVDQVAKVPLGNLKVSGTPTAIVVNRQGVIERVLAGMLDAARQAQLLSALKVAS